MQHIPFDLLIPLITEGFWVAILVLPGAFIAISLVLIVLHAILLVFGGKHDPLRSAAVAGGSVLLALSLWAIFLSGRVFENIILPDTALDAVKISKLMLSWGWISPLLTLIIIGIGYFPRKKGITAVILASSALFLSFWCLFHGWVMAAVSVNLLQKHNLATAQRIEIPDPPPKPAAPPPSPKPKPKPKPNPGTPQLGPSLFGEELKNSKE